MIAEEHSFRVGSGALLSVSLACSAARVQTQVRQRILFDPKVVALPSKWAAVVGQRN